MRLLYFSPVYSQSYAQRPHFMIRYFLDRGGEEVLWVNPYPTRLPRVGDLRRRDELYKQGTVFKERVKILDVPAIPVEPIIGGALLNRLLCWRDVLDKILRFSTARECILGIGRPSALANLALKLKKYRWSFYDAMDDFSEFYGGLSRSVMKHRERRIAESVDRVFVSSTYLSVKFQRWGIASELVHNACAPESFPPCERKGNGEAVYGYVGTMGSWFDWDLLSQVAKAVHKDNVWLTGPLFSPPPDDFPENVKLLPACRHEEVANWLSEFSVGLIPFKKNALTRAVDPIKFYDYCAMGLPVLSTCVGEMSRRSAHDGVFFLDGPGGIPKAVSQARMFKQNMENVERFRKENSWNSRFSAAGLFTII